MKSAGREQSLLPLHDFSRLYSQGSLPCDFAPKDSIDLMSCQIILQGGNSGPKNELLL